MDEELNPQFKDWIYSNLTPFSLRIEYFYGDCATEDVKEREKLMIKWMQAAFEAGQARS